MQSTGTEIGGLVYTNEDGYLSTIHDDNVFVKGELNGETTRVIYHYKTDCWFCNEFKNAWNETVRSNRGSSVEFRASPGGSRLNYPVEFKKPLTYPFVFKVNKLTDSTARYMILGSDQRGLIQSFIKY